MQARVARRLRHCQRASARPHAAIERQFPEQRVALQPLPPKLPAGREQRAREREIQARPRLWHVARREVGGDPPGGELIAGVEDRRLNALARLTYGGVGETDDRECGQPGADVDLDGHVSRVQPFDRERMRPASMAPCLLPPVLSGGSKG